MSNEKIKQYNGNKRYVVCMDKPITDPATAKKVKEHLEEMCDGEVPFHVLEMTVNEDGTISVG